MDGLMNSDKRLANIVKEPSKLTTHASLKMPKPGHAQAQGTPSLIQHCHFSVKVNTIASLTLAQTKQRYKT